MLDARLGDLVSQTLGYPGNLGHTMSFGDQAGHIDSHGKKTVAVQQLNAGLSLASFMSQGLP